MDNQKKKIDPNDYFLLGYRVAHVFLKRNPHLYHLREDIEQEAALAVIETALRFEDRGTIKFSTYCARQVQNAILKYLRDFENKYRFRSLEELVTLESEDDSMSWEELIPGVTLDIEQAIAKMPEDMKYFVKLKCEGKTRHQIREILGCSWNHYCAQEARIYSYIENLYDM